MTAAAGCATAITPHPRFTAAKAAIDENLAFLDQYRSQHLRLHVDSPYEP
jgi:hypothetical protein